MNAPDTDNDIRLQNLLAAHLDSLIADDAAYFAAAPVDASDLMHLAMQLNHVLIPIEPSPEFVARLRSEFIGDTPMTLLLRWRSLPPRYQVAAKVGGFTLTAGLTLLAARRALTAMSRARQPSESDAALSLNTLS